MNKSDMNKPPAPPAENVEVNMTDVQPSTTAKAKQRARSGPLLLCAGYLNILLSSPPG